MPSFFTPGHLPDLANWSRSSFLQSPDATLEYTAGVSCYQLTTVCPSVKTYLPSLLKTLSIKIRKKVDQCLLGLEGNIELILYLSNYYLRQLANTVKLGKSQVKKHLWEFLEKLFDKVQTTKRWIKINNPALKKPW